MDVDNHVLLLLKAVWVGRFKTPNLTYLETTGLFTSGENSVQPLQRYYNPQTCGKVGVENLYLGNPSHFAIGVFS